MDRASIRNSAAAPESGATPVLFFKGLSVGVLAVVLILATASSVGVRAWAQPESRNKPQVGAINTDEASLAGQVAPESRGSNIDVDVKVTRFAMRSDGDHSLDAAIVVEQALPGDLARYTVRLQLASGAEQSVALTAPPGGLQPEMLDMTGDMVPNDLVLTPTLFRWAPTVLLNDGHNHFSVAFPSLSGQHLSSGTHHVQDTAALASSGFRVRELANSGRLLFLPQFQEYFLSSAAKTVASPSTNAPHSGRAPPALV